MTHFFGGQLAERIMAQAIPIIGGPDVRIWQSSSTPKVVIKDLHDLHRGEPVRQIDGAWIWRLGAHPRVCLFIWKVAWSQLPNRALLQV